MISRHRRIGLIGSASLLVMALGFLQQAHAAGTTATVGTITPAAIDPASILNALSTTGATPGSTNLLPILSLQTVVGPSSGISTTTGSTNLILDTAGNNSIFNNNNNAILALTRGNNVSSTIGNNTEADGSVILNAQQVLPGSANEQTALSASTTGNIDSTVLFGNGTNVTGNLNNNAVQARVSYNTAFGDIETTVPNTINAVAGSYAAGFTGIVDPTSVTQTANYNIASVQANSGFVNGAPAGQAAATVDDTLITLSRIYFSFGTPTISGTYKVNGNLVDATAVGNAADNGILLQDGGAGSFAGSAFSSSTQLSRESFCRPACRRSPPATPTPSSRRTSSISCRGSSSCRRATA